MGGFGLFRGRLPMMVVTAALVLCTLISAWQAVRANAKAAAEWNARQAEIQLRQRAEASERRAREVAAEAQSILTFLDEWIVGASRPMDQKGGLGKDATVREAIDSAGAAAATAFPNEPLAEAMVRTLLGKSYSHRGEAAPAIRHLEQAVQLHRENLGGEHLTTLTSLNNLGVTYGRFGQFDRALSCFEETRRQLQRLVPRNHPDLLTSTHNLAGVYQNVGRLDQAISLLEETLRGLQATLGPEHPVSLMTMTNLAVAHDMAKDYTQAESFFRESLRLQQRLPGHQRNLILDTQAFLGRTLLHQEKYTEAAAVLLECTVESQKLQPNVWQTFYYQTLLGGALQGEARNLRADDQVVADDKLAGAEALLRKGYEGMLAREDTMFAQHKPLIAEALERLIELYEQLDRPEDAARWRSELEARTSKANSSKCGL